MWGEFDLSEQSVTLSYINKPHGAQICSSYKQVDLVGDAGDLVGDAGDMLHHLNTPDMLRRLCTPQRVDVGGFWPS